MKDLEYSGLWWLPSSQEDMIAGTLTFSNQDGIHLNLIGSFKEMTKLSSLETYPLILGVTSGGKLLTLYDCMESGLRRSFPGFMSQQLSARTAYIGAHFADPQEIRFHKTRVQYSHLPDWVRLSGFHTQYTVRNQVGFDKYELTYTLPEEVKATTAKGTVSVTYAFHTRDDLLGEVNLRQSVSARIEAQEAQPFEEGLSQFIYPLQNFLSLATARPNSVLDVVAYSDQKTVNGPNGKVELPIQVVFRTVFQEAEPHKPLFPHDMLFTLQDVSDDFSEVIGRWLGVADELDSVCNLFFSVQYKPEMYLEQRFLNMVRAAESYHRRRFSNQVLSEEEHRNRVDYILAQTPEKYGNWLVEQLQYSNEPSLRRRIKELINTTDEVVSPLVPDRKSFIQKIVDTRNFLTHYDPSLRDGAVRGAELYQYTQTLSFLVQMCFLRELGLSSQRCVELFRRNQPYLFAMRQTQQSE